MAKAKVTQTKKKGMDCYETPGMLLTPVKAFFNKITGDPPDVPTGGYGDLEAPGERDVTVSRNTGGTHKGQGSLQRFTRGKG